MSLRACWQLLGTVQLHCKQLQLIVLSAPYRIIFGELTKDVGTLFKQRRQLRVLHRRPDGYMRMRQSLLHVFRDFFPRFREGQQGFSRVLYSRCRKVVRWKIAGDHPPTNVSGGP